MTFAAPPAGGIERWGGIGDSRAIQPLPNTGGDFVVRGRGQGAWGQVQVTVGAVEQAVQVPRYSAMKIRASVWAGWRQRAEPCDLLGSEVVVS